MVNLHYGDLAKWYTGQRRTSEIKSNLDRLTSELTSGVKQDLAAHLGYDRIRVSEIDERISRINVLEKSSQNVSSLLGAQQLALSDVEKNRLALSTLALDTANNTSNIVTVEAKSRFSDMVRALGTQFAGKSVFSGNKDGTPPLPAGETMLADLKAHVNFNQPSASVLNDIVDYFTDASGRYSSIHYKGGDDVGLERQVAENTSVSIGTTATNPKIAKALAQTAALAVASEIADPATRTAFIRDAAVQLQGNRSVIDLKGEIGMAEARTARSRASNASALTALKIERNTRVSADQLETATELKKVETQLQTHFTLLSHMSKLTLTNFLR